MRSLISLISSTSSFPPPVHFPPFFHPSSSMRRPSWNSTWSRSRSSRLTSSWKRSRKWKMKPSQSSWPWNRYGYPGRARGCRHISWPEEKFGACTQPFHNLLMFWWQDLSPGEHACTHCRCSLLNSHVSTKWNFPRESIFTAGTWLYIRFWGHYFITPAVPGRDVVILSKCTGTSACGNCSAEHYLQHFPATIFMPLCFW